MGRTIVTCKECQKSLDQKDAFEIWSNKQMQGYLCEPCTDRIAPK